MHTLSQTFERAAAMTPPQQAQNPNESFIYKQVDRIIELRNILQRYLTSKSE